MGDTDNAPNGEVLKLLREIAAQNNEIKQDIKEIKRELVKHTETIGELKNKINVLELENSEIKKELRITQRKIKKNNIIIFGLPDDEELDVKTQVKALAANSLGVTLEEIEIDNVYRIGTKKVNKPRAVIVELVRNIKKQEIFKNVTKLKGTGIIITNDLIPEEIEEKKVLVRHLKLAREKQYNATIKNNKLVVNGETYTCEDLKNIDAENISEFYCRHVPHSGSSSAPATPTITETPDFTYVKGDDREDITKGNKNSETKNENPPSSGAIPKITSAFSRPKRVGTCKNK